MRGGMSVRGERRGTGREGEWEGERGRKGRESGESEGKKGEGEKG